MSTNIFNYLYVRKQDGYSENKVFPFLKIEDFESEQFDTVRKLVRLTRADHPWAKMTNEELLFASRLRLKDIHTGRGYCRKRKQTL